MNFGRPGGELSWRKERQDRRRDAGARRKRRGSGHAVERTGDWPDRRMSRVIRNQCERGADTSTATRTRAGRGSCACQTPRIICDICARGGGHVGASRLDGARSPAPAPGSRARCDLSRRPRLLSLPQNPADANKASLHGVNPTPITSPS